MSKRCPVCGESFPDSAQYCDQDGMALQPVGLHRARSKSRSRRVWLVGLAVLCVICVAFLPFLAKQYLSLKVDVVVDSISVHPVVGTDGYSIQGFFEQLFGQREPKWKDIELALRLRVRNNSPFQISFASARYTVQLGEHDLTSGIWTPEGGRPQVFQPGEELPISVVFHPEVPDAFDIGSELRNSSPPSVRVYGQLSAKAMGINFTWPFEVRSVRIELGVRPEEGREPSLAPSESDRGLQLSV